MRLSIVAVFGLVALPTIASATAGNDDPNVVHACVANASLTVRIVGVSGSCIASPPSKAETPAHWNIQGPQGPPGANGTNGTNGIDGTSVAVLGNFSGAENGCPNGGTILGTANGNAYVCNGQDATGATNPDPPCFDNTNRYVDCLNGTVTDTVTGLIWLQDAAPWCHRLGCCESGGGSVEKRRLRLDGRVLTGRLAAAHQGRVECDDRASCCTELHRARRALVDERCGLSVLHHGSVVVCGRGVEPTLLVEYLRWDGPGRRP